MCFRKEKPSQPRLAFDVMLGIWGKSRGVLWFGAFAAVAFTRADGAASEFRFDRDTFAFANQTVFEYHEGHASLRKSSATKKDAYNRHCFVMSRTAAQFKKFARFEPRSAPLDDASLAARVRAITRQAAWAEPLPENQRIVFPGYKDLKEMSKAPSRTRAIKYRAWLAELLSNEQRPNDVSRRYRVPGKDSCPVERGVGARRVVRRISYNLSPVHHQSLGFDL